MKADAGFASLGHAGHVNMVGVGHKAGNRAGIEQDHAAAPKANIAVGDDVPGSGHVATFLETPRTMPTTPQVPWSWTGVHCPGSHTSAKRDRLPLGAIWIALRA